MGLLTKCPKCGCTIAKGTTCPNCLTGEAPTSMPQGSLVEEFERRRGVHRRHYFIFMATAMALGLTTLLLIVTLFMLTKGWRVANLATHYVAPPVKIDFAPGDEPSDPNVPNLDDAPPVADDRIVQTHDSGSMEMGDPDGDGETVPMPKLNPDDFSYAGLLFWLVLLVTLMLLEGGLGFLLVKCRSWWPIELLCPNCGERIDEVGGNFERCPSCMARLQ